MPFIVLWCGDFGGAVAAELEREGWSERSLARPTDAAGAISGADAVVFATWRERRDLTEALDEACWEAGVPWLCAVAEHPWVRVGPAITPARTPCYRCYVARRQQHDGNRHLSTALDSAYLADPLLGVRGYLPHHATIAAGLARHFTDRSLDGDEWRAPVGRYHTMWHELTLDHVVGVDNCSRCDLDRTARGNAAITASLMGGRTGDHAY